MKNYLLVIGVFVMSQRVCAQIGINTEAPKATMDIRAKVSTGSDVASADGILIPRIDRERASSMTNIENSTLIYINDVSTGSANVGEVTEYISSPGFYYYEATKSRWQSINYKNDFYYSPSLLLPTASDDSRLGTAGFSLANDIYTVDLYSIFSHQFVHPQVASSSTATLSNFVKKATDYDYFVSYADNTVFTNIVLTVDGKLSYKIAPNSIIRNGSFMNIILKEN